MLMPRGRYLGPNESVQALLQKLKSQGKKLFIITNSGELWPPVLLSIYGIALAYSRDFRVSLCGRWHAAHVRKGLAELFRCG